MKYFYLQPRQSGKTDKAVYEYLKDKDNTLLVVHNNENTKRFKSINSNIKNVILEKDLKESIEKKQFKTIILDEYLSYKNKKKVYEIVNSTSVSNIYIISSPNKVYKKELFEIVKDCKKHDFISVSPEELFKFPKEDFEELYYNFITDKDTILIDKRLSSISLKEEEMKNKIGEELFNLEVSIQYLK